MTDVISIDDLERFRRPLTAYCYRMLAGAVEAEDAVQETLIRAGSRLETFDPARGALRSWLFRIATNICLDLLRASRRRAVAIDLGPASRATAALGEPLPPDRWVEPMPTARLVAADDPAELVALRESVRFAFVAALQYLAPRQRAVLILRDIVGFSAAEAADLLETTPAAVHSALQRARDTLAAHRPLPTSAELPSDPEQRDLLDRYVAAFESHDVDALTAVLRHDATTSMPPFAWWVQGAHRIANLMASGGCDGARLVPTEINGAAGFGQYRPDDVGTLEPFALVLVETDRERVTSTVTFLGTQGRFTEFGLPERLEPAGIRPASEMAVAPTDESTASAT